MKLGNDGKGEKMMARPACPGEGEESLCAYIERANTLKPRSKTKNTLWFVGVAVAAAMSILLLPVDVNCLFAIIAVFLVTIIFGLCEFVFFQKANEFSYGLDCLTTADWRYMEMYFRERKSGFFGRIMRSPAFVLIAGFYYELKVGDKEAAEKLLALARGREPELETIEMTPHRGLLRREREVLLEKIRRDLGVTWIYKLKQKKLLWATGGLLLFLLFVIRYVMILIDSSRLLIKGLAE